MAVRISYGSRRRARLTAAVTLGSSARRRAVALMLGFISVPSRGTVRQLPGPIGCLPAAAVRHRQKERVRSWRLLRRVERVQLRQPNGPTIREPESFQPARFQFAYGGPILRIELLHQSHGTMQERRQ